ncbi:hypothetical protein HDU96_008550 [Phlyctochytrium bullatum]|nr:hypothetical protein HDU96_008550 [Phlyctochytrium bullatum]
MEDVDLMEMIGEFQEVAVEYAIQIVEDYHLKDSTLVMPLAEPDLGGLTIIDGIDIQFATNYQVSTSDDVAIKNALSSSEIKCIDAFNKARTGLRTALMVTVDYRGFRIIACPHAGIGDKVHVDPAQKFPYVVNLCDSMPIDYVPPPPQSPDSSPYRGNPVSPRDESNATQFNLAAYTKTQQLRPEFVKAYAMGPICADAFTSAAGSGTRERNENNSEAIAACMFLRETWIPGFTAKFDNLEFRPVDSRSLSLLLHSAGINIRYLGLIASRSNIPYIQELGCIEMVSRTAKCIFRNRMRKQILSFRALQALNTQDQARSLAITIFTSVLCLDERGLKCGVAFAPTTDYNFSNPQSLMDPTKFLGFMPKKKHLNGIPVDFSVNYKTMTLSIRDGSVISGHVGSVLSTAVPQGLNEEGRQAYLLARHFKSLGPKGKLGKSDASALRLTEVAAHYNATGRFEEAKRYATAALNAASVNSCISAFAKAQIIDAIGALTCSVLPNETTSSHIASIAGASTSPSGGNIAADPMITTYYTSAVETVQWHCGINSPMEMALHDRMSHVFLRARMLPLALEYHKKSLNIAIAALGKNHVITAGYFTRMGVLQLQLQQTDNAVDRLTEALNIHLSLKSAPVLTAEVHGHLADAYDAKGDIDNAIYHSQQCKKLRENEFQQHDPRSVASYMQVATLILKPYAGYAGVLTPQIRAAYKEAISCLEKVFRYIFNMTNMAARSSMNWNSGASVLSAAPSRLSAVTHSMIDGSTISSSLSTLPYVRAPPIAGPFLEAPFGGPLPPMSKSILHQVTKKIVGLKLALIESPKQKEAVRTLRAQLAQQDVTGTRTFNNALAKDVILRIGTVAPSVYLDNLLNRVEDNDISAIEELSTAIQIAEKETLP